MIKIVKYIESKEVKNQSDLYIPIDIKFGFWNSSDEPSVYWRTGDFKHSLLEVGIGKYKKDIRSITLVNCNNVCEESNHYEENFTISNGSPIFELETADKRDEENILKVYIEDTGVSIIFSEKKVNECIKNYNIYFYLDENKMFIGFKIENINELNKNTIKKALLLS